MSAEESSAVREAHARLEEWLDGARPEVAIVLGSGLSAGGFALEESRSIDLSEVPGLLRPAVEGHSSEWRWGRFEGRSLLLVGGRVHLYEGYGWSEATRYVSVLAALGCRGLLVTNAAGGIRPDLQPGRIMRIRGFLNLSWRSTPRSERFPLGFDAEWGDRIDPARLPESAVSRISEGVYAMCSGPCYETPAEIDAFEKLGADAVGMSTVPETIEAVRRGMSVLGFSLITNPAAGRGSEKLTHDDVKVAAAEGSADLRSVLLEAARVF